MALNGKSQPGEYSCNALVTFWYKKTGKSYNYLLMKDNNEITMTYSEYKKFWLT